MIGRLVLNLLKYRDTIAMQHESITVGAFPLLLPRIFWIY